MMKGIEFRKIYIHTYNVESFAKKFKINNNNNNNKNISIDFVGNTLLHL